MGDTGASLFTAMATTRRNGETPLQLTREEAVWCDGEDAAGTSCRCN